MKLKLALLILATLLVSSQLHAQEYKFEPGAKFRATVIVELEADASGTKLNFTKFLSQFIIGGQVGPIPPGPGPGPDPDPPGPIPDGEFGLTKFTYGLASSITNSRDKAVGFAVNYQAVSAQLAAGGYPDVGTANQDLTARNRSTLGDVASVKEEWTDKFFTPHGGKMRDLIVAGTIDANDLQAVAKAYEATSDGLKLIK